MAALPDISFCPKHRPLLEAYNEVIPVVTDFLDKYAKIEKNSHEIWVANKKLADIVDSIGVIFTSNIFAHLSCLRLNPASFASAFVSSNASLCDSALKDK